MTPSERRLNDPPPMNPQSNQKKPGTTEEKSSNRNQGRWHQLNEFTDMTMRELSPRQVAVWLCLFRDSRNGIASVSQAYIAERCGLKRPTVSQAIAELEALGLVLTVHTGGVGRGVSKYRVQSLIQTPK